MSLNWIPSGPLVRKLLIVSVARAASGVAAAAWGNLWHSRTRGASTLTMQLAGLLDADLKAGSGGRSLWQKLGLTDAEFRLWVGLLCLASANKRRGYVERDTGSPYGAMELQNLLGIEAFKRADLFDPAAAPLVAERALEDRLHRPQLRGPRRRDGQRRSGSSPALSEAAERAGRYRWLAVDRHFVQLMTVL